MLFFAGRMEQVLFLFVGLLMVIVIPLILAGIAFFIVRRNNKNRAVWKSAAQAMNLKMPNPKQLKLSGLHDGCHATIAVGARRSNESTVFFTWCAAEFPETLRFLLGIRSPKGVFTSVFGADRVELGEPLFDGAFAARCYDREVLRRLLLSDFPTVGARNLMDDLLLALRRFPIISITDNQVYIETGGQVGDEEEIRRMLGITSRLIRRFSAARAGFPLAPWEERLFADYAEFAAENDLIFDPLKLVVEGFYQGFQTRISLVSASGRWQTRVRLTFGQSLMIGLRLLPENLFHKTFSWLGLQDVEVGIEEFDDLFIVKAKDAGTARRVLNRELCDQLIGLNKQASSFEIDDEGLVAAFDRLAGDKASLKHFFDAAVTTAKMFEQRESQNSSGPDRTSANALGT